MMESLLYPSIIDFSLLAIISYVVRIRFMREGMALTGSGSIVMAIAIFGLYALPSLPWNLVSLTPYVALELLIIWLFLMASFVQCYIRNHFSIHTRALLNRFNIGTWSAGSALLAVLLLKAFPEWYEVTWPIGLLAIMIWIAYLKNALDDLWRIVRNHLTLQLNGSLFLTTISTQCIVILLAAMVPGWFPTLFSLGLILLGYLTYMLSFIVIAHNYSRLRLHNIVVEWGNTNCMAHGALSISGLAAILTNAIPDYIIIISWMVTALLFVLVESLSVARLYVRVRKKHILRGALGYEITQWVRVFSYGMFYAFTVMLQQYPDTLSEFYVKGITNLIANSGQYVVLVMLLIEIGIFLRAKLRYHALRQVNSFQ